MVSIIELNNINSYNFDEFFDKLTNSFLHYQVGPQEF